MKNSKKENVIFKFIFTSLRDEFYIKDIIDGSDFAMSTVHDSIYKLELSGLITAVEKGFDKTSAIPRQLTAEGVSQGLKEIKSWLPDDKDCLNLIKQAIDQKIDSLH